MLRIKIVRKRLGMSLADVAAGCDVLPEAIARAERDGTDPKASTVTKLAKAMGVPVCELFDEPGHDRRRKKKA